MSNLDNTDKSAKQNKARKNLKLNHDLTNPCMREHHLSLKCLDDNNYDRSLCGLYFENYNACQSFWKRIRAERRAKGIEPYLPPPEERPKIKAEYLQSKKQQ